MAFPDPVKVCPMFDCALQALKCLFVPRRQGFYRRCPEDIFARRREFGPITRYDAGEGRRKTVLLDNAGRSMQFGALVGERHQQGFFQTVCGRENIECFLRIEPLHFDEPVERRTVAADGEAVLGIHRDRHGADIQFRCGTPVERHLPFRAAFAGIQGRVIEIGRP